MISPEMCKNMAAKSPAAEAKRKAMRAAEAAQKIGFLYAPVGWQREDMGRALYERGGLYKRVLNDVGSPASAEVARDPLVSFAAFAAERVHPVL